MTLADLLTFVAAIPAGIGGVMLGDRIMGAWLNRHERR